MITANIYPPLSLKLSGKRERERGLFLYTHFFFFLGRKERNWQNFFLYFFLQPNKNIYEFAVNRSPYTIHFSGTFLSHLLLYEPPVTHQLSCYIHPLYLQVVHLSMLIHLRFSNSIQPNLLRIKLYNPNHLVYLLQAPFSCFAHISRMDNRPFSI